MHRWRIQSFIISLKSTGYRIELPSRNQRKNQTCTSLNRPTWNTWIPRLLSWLGWRKKISSMKNRSKACWPSSTTLCLIQLCLKIKVTASSPTGIGSWLTNCLSKYLRRKLISAKLICRPRRIWDIIFTLFLICVKNF